MFRPFETHLGPFASDGSVHEVEIPAIEAWDTAPRTERAPPPPSEPGKESLRVRVVDAVTGLGIHHASVTLRTIAEETYGFDFCTTGKDGRTNNARFQPGLYQLTASADDHRRSEPIEITIRAGETIDLGTISLQPLPRTTIRLLEADGRPAPRGTQVTLTHPNDEEARWLQTTVRNDEGEAVVRAALGRGVTVDVTESRGTEGSPSGRAKQWLSVDIEVGATVQEIRLSPWHPFEVTVTGAIREMPGVHVKLILKLPDSNPEDRGGYYLDEALPLSDGSRRFRGEFGGTGRFKLVLRSLVLQTASRDITIEDTSALQRFDLVSTR
jgi:5-hydroxyisourate hydrolase-like protein (transthyretin family)